jgi:two-component system, response regulator YesN
MMKITATDRDVNKPLDLKQAIQAAESFSCACQVPCRVVDQLGNTLHLASPSPELTLVCDLACTVMPGTGSRPDSETSQICANSHLYGCYQAERFGGRYVFFCPLGMTHWASPIMLDGNVVGSLLGGPVHIVDPEDFLIEDLVAKNGIHPDYLPQLHLDMSKVPVLGTERVNALSELLFRVAASISDDSFKAFPENNDAGDLQKELWEQVDFMKSYAHKVDADLVYPIEKEDLLLEKIEMGDKAASQRILNEILGHVFFSSGGSIEVMRARVLELAVLLSRAAIRGGADVQQIFGLNYTYLNKIISFRNIDEIAYWLSGIMARFTDQVFNLTHVKHADVIYRAVSYIKKNYMNRITLEETAASVFLSPAYFSRIFKEETGDNFNTYVNNTRIEAAKRLLLNEKIQLVDIPTMVGIEGQSYFSKVFKKVTGFTPGKFRECRGKIKPLK